MSKKDIAKRVILQACANPGRICSEAISEAKEPGDCPNEFAAYAIISSVHGLYHCMCNPWYTREGKMNFELFRFDEHIIYDRNTDGFFGIYLVPDFDNYVGTFGFVIDSVMDKFVDTILDNVDDYLGIMTKYVYDTYGVEYKDKDKELSLYFDFNSFMDFHPEVSKKTYVTTEIGSRLHSVVSFEDVYPFFEKPELTDCDILTILSKMQMHDIIRFVNTIVGASAYYDLYKETAEDPLCYYTVFKDIKTKIRGTKKVHVVLETDLGDQDIVVEAERFFGSPEYPNYWAVEAAHRPMIQHLVGNPNSYDSLKQIKYKGKVIWSRKDDEI